MTLRAVLEEMRATAVRGNPDVEVSGLAYDSRRVRPGDLFFALGGLKADGRAFVRQALEAGAAAAVVPGAPPEAATATLVEVEDARLALAQAALRFHGHPSRALQVVAVTGTNGKTTITWLVRAILEAAGIPAGVIGTTGVRVGEESRALSFTTPEAPELQALLREMVERGMRGVALEVSSHALAQRRSYGLEPNVAVFTNLSHDHLDYHGTLERYLDAKRMLFDGRNDPARTRPGAAVLNRDDPAFPEVRASALSGGLAVRSFGAAPGSDLTIEDVEARPAGLTFTLVEESQRVPIALPLLGRYNAWNAAAAYGATRALGIAPETARRGLERAPAVPGRLERVDHAPFAMVVDYAHTPDALGRALSAVREHFKGRVLLVFGCGGDRDRAKRPVMGGIAAERADQAWVTNDNPRSEDPAVIAAEILAGAPPGRLAVELDRRSALRAALAAARAGDVVLIAGKGHETTQTIGDRVLPFDDRAVARELLAEGGMKW